MISINSIMRLANANLRLLLLMIWAAGLVFGAQAAPSAAQTNFAAWVRSNYEQAERRYQNKPDEAEAAWQFGRACFDLAEFATNRTERAALAEQGISACRPLVARQPNLAPAHYYLAKSLAQLARTKGLAALMLVGEMEREFSLARKLDAPFDYAGADRHLGLLYRDAPAIGSIGSRAKARQHLQQAVTVAPDYPANRLNLIESCLKWGDRSGAQRELAVLEKEWSRARTNFVGVAWAASWADWQPRLKKVQAKLQD
jgi:hypothetical protein